jgi:hypothetical protein
MQCLIRLVMGQLNFIRDLIDENKVWKPNLSLIEKIGFLEDQI